MSQSNPSKKQANKKIILGAAAIASIIAVIAVSSFIPFAIKPENWQTTQFLTDELIICAIVIFAMVATIFIGQASNGQNEKSNLAKARVRFLAEKEKVKDINRFRQWIKKVLQPQDIEDIKIRELRRVGVNDISYLDLEYAELKSLIETPQKYNGRFYKGISKEQYKVILNIKKGKYKINLVEPEYYLSVKGIGDIRTVSERSADEGKKKASYLAMTITGRLILTVMCAMIFASLVRDLASDQDTAEAWMKFVSRMWALISSCFMGYIVGCKINDIDAEYIEMRAEVLIRSQQDTDFVGVSEQDEAKQEFIERVKKENVLSLEDKTMYL